MAAARCARAMLLLAVMPALAGRGARAADGTEGALLAAGGSEGALLAAGRRAVRARLGGAATLECRAQAAAQVSWVRVRDLQILSHAGAVFTADARVSASARTLAPPARGAAHELRIAPLRASDAGLYECQLNTEPKTSLLFNLTVTDGAEPEVFIRAWRDDDDDAAAAGGAVLRCEARAAGPGGAAPTLHWLLAGEPLTLQGGVAVESAVESSAGAGGRASSRLTLGDGRARAGGRYSCAARGDADDAVLAAAHVDLPVHLSPDNEMEAMQRDQSTVAGGTGVHPAISALTTLAALSVLAA